MTNITIETLKPEHAAELEVLQQICLPTLDDDELLLEEHFFKHCELFPKGNFVAITDNGKIVGLGSGFLIDFDFDHPDHRFNEIIDEGYYTQHDPNGDWYYGADITVHPDYRRRGIGGMLYAARKGIIRRLNRKGLVAGGLIPGYADYKDTLTVQAYVDKVVAGDLYDPTLSFQLKHGFEVRGLLEDYIDDAASDNWSTLLVWENPDYSAN